jgi:tetrahydromethanopterin S-methyltransferase subunit G
MFSFWFHVIQVQNREYENTINLLHKRLRQEAISDKVENTQNTKTCDISCMNDIKMRMQKLEESVESKFTVSCCRTCGVNVATGNC